MKALPIPASRPDAPASSAAPFAHPAFDPYRALIDALGLARGLPALAALNAAAAARDARLDNDRPLRFAAPENRLSARDYETGIRATGTVPTRPDTWHDTLNALVWLRFPRFKSALNAAHCAALAGETGATRGPRRDALTVLDESGVWVLGGDAGRFELLAAHAWTALFWTRRREVETAMRFIVVGHALLEKALAPFPAMTGKCLPLAGEPFDLGTGDPDAAAVRALAGVAHPRQLPPLPIQGVPGWDPANAHAGYYANAAVFRPPRAPLSPARTTA